MPASPEMREVRDSIVREHMEVENALKMDRALETLARPRYEFIGTGKVYDGPEEVARCVASRGRLSPTSATS